MNRWKRKWLVYRGLWLLVEQEQQQQPRDTIWTRLIELTAIKQSDSTRPVHKDYPRAIKDPMDGDGSEPLFGN